MKLTGIVQQLRREREKAQSELNRLDAAITALGGVGRSVFERGPKRGKRKVSAAARAKMAAAQRARRAREKGRTPTPIRAKRRISAAGLARIRAAQKARWAKWKQQQKAA